MAVQLGISVAVFSLLVSPLLASEEPTLTSRIVRFGSGSGPLGGSEAVRIESASIALTAQILPTNSSGMLPSNRDADAQVSVVLERLGHALRDGGSSMSEILRLNAVVDGFDSAAALARGLAAAFPRDRRPAVTLAEGVLPISGAMVAVDAVAVSGRIPDETERSRWYRSAALGGEPGATHVAVLETGPRVYLSGRAGDGSPREATLAVLEEMDQTLAFLGLQKSHVVQLKCFVRPVLQAPEVHRQIVEFFGGRAPPVVFVEWLNRQTIEIEAVVASPDMNRASAPLIEFLTPPGMTSSPVFARVARVRRSDAIYVSTLYGRTPGRGDLQVREMFAELSRILEGAGSDLRHLAKATYYVTDDLTSRSLNEIRPEFYDPDRPPTASKASVRGTAVPGRTLAVDMIAIPLK